MKRLPHILVALLLGAARPAAAQIVGSWQGTSTCVDLVRFPACKNETVIYDVTAAGGTDTVTIRADKIVNGEREFMAELTFIKQGDGSWIGEFQNPRYHGRWILVIQGDAMTGRLEDLPARTPVRSLSLHRAKDGER